MFGRIYRHRLSQRLHFERMMRKWTSLPIKHCVENSYRESTGEKFITRSQADTIHKRRFILCGWVCFRHAIGQFAELPMMAYAGGSTRKRYVSFWGLPSGIWKGRDFTSWRIIKGYGNLSFGSVKGLTDEFSGFMKSVDSCLKYSAFKQGMWKRYHLST